jgi:predicted aspartyl protease
MNVERLLERARFVYDSYISLELLRQERENFDVGPFTCKIENPTDRTRSLVIPKLLVDTGSEYTWVSERSLERIGISREKKDVAFVLANGQEVTRSVGFAIIRLDKFFTIDEILFGEPGDLQLLGARTLEGLNLVIEPSQRRLVATGPLPAASPTSPRAAYRSQHTALVGSPSNAGINSSPPQILLSSLLYCPPAGCKG